MHTAVAYNLCTQFLQNHHHFSKTCRQTCRQTCRHNRNYCSSWTVNPNELLPCSSRQSGQRRSIWTSFEFMTDLPDVRTSVINSNEVLKNRQSWYRRWTLISIVQHKNILLNTSSLPISQPTLSPTRTHNNNTIRTSTAFNMTFSSFSFFADKKGANVADSRNNVFGKAIRGMNKWVGKALMKASYLVIRVDIIEWSFSVWLQSSYTELETMGAEAEFWFHNNEWIKGMYYGGEEYDDERRNVLWMEWIKKRSILQRGDEGVVLDLGFLSSSLACSQKEVPAAFVLHMLLVEPVWDIYVFCWQGAVIRGGVAVNMACKSTGGVGLKRIGCCTENVGANNAADIWFLFLTGAQFCSFTNWASVI